MILIIRENIHKLSMIFLTIQDVLICGSQSNRSSRNMRTASRPAISGVG